MHRKRILRYILVLILITTIVGSTTFIIGSTQSDSNEETLYSSLRSYEEALSIVRNNFVDPDMVDPQTLIYGSIDGMMKSLEDPHSAFLPPDEYESLMSQVHGEYGGLGMYIGIRNEKLTVISPIEDTPAFRAGMRPGDVITQINGESTDGISLDEAVATLRGAPGSPVTITIMREAEFIPREITLIREVINIASVKYTMLDNNIGYIRITTFSDDTATDMRSALNDLNEQGMEKIIVDVRSNPGGRLDIAVEICDMFIDEGILVSTRHRHAYDNQIYRGSKDRTLCGDIPLIVLTNRGSASASEILTGALQDTSRGIAIGETTYGKGSVQSIMQLRSSSQPIALRITIARYYTPAGRNIHGIGLEPDISVPEPEYTNEERFYISQLSSNGNISDFVASHPNYSDNDVAQFQQELQDECILLDIDILERLLYDEKHRLDPPTVANPEFDPILSKAIETFTNGEYPELQQHFYY